MKNPVAALLLMFFVLLFSAPASASWTPTWVQCSARLIASKLPRSLPLPWSTGNELLTWTPLSIRTETPPNEHIHREGPRAIENYLLLPGQADPFRLEMETRALVGDERLLDRAVAIRQNVSVGFRLLEETSPQLAVSTGLTFLSRLRPNGRAQNYAGYFGQIAQIVCKQGPRHRWNVL